MGIRLCGGTSGLVDEYLQILIKLSDFELEESATYDIGNLLQAALPGSDVGVMTRNEITHNHRMIQIESAKINDAILLIAPILRSASLPAGSYMTIHSQGKAITVDLEREIDAYIDT